MPTGKLKIVILNMKKQSTISGVLVCLRIYLAWKKIQGEHIISVLALE
jgi:hypothetical protein